MANEIFFLAILIIGGLLVIFLLLYKKLSRIEQATKPDQTLIEWLKTQQEVSQQTSRVINERLDRAAQVIAEVQKSLGEMSEIGRGMRDLQEFLRSPKIRGNIGEQVLKEILGQMLPRQSFYLQYTFRSGATVDAAIKTTSGIIPVDSKFPLENFRKMNKAENEAEKRAAEKEFVKDVKNHIDAISSKYILTEEGTIDYALMYIPSEAVYYEVVNNPDLFDYAGKKRVLPVSPMTFYAYLRAILASFEGQKIEQKAKQILATLRAIQKDYQKVEGSLSVLSRHLQNAYNQMANVLTTFTQLGQKLSSSEKLEEPKPLP
jgi:DNA recombination protein RmuC